MKRGDYAYIPGSGPEDKHCKDCGAVKVVSKTNGRCHKAAELRRISILKLETIPLISRACRYFEERG